MAHVYTLANGLQSNPGPLAAAHVYFHRLYDRLNLGFQCSGPELFADVLATTVLPGETWLWDSCNGGNAARTQEALAVVRSALRGVMPAWFETTYGSGTPDLERFWSHVKALHLYTGGPRRAAIYQLRDDFGGYCSIRTTNESAYEDGAVRNPWKDGGCVPGAPGNVSASTTQPGHLSVSWTAPDSDGGAPVEGYKVQWKSGSQDYDASRQALIADPDESLHVIKGLSVGTRYSVRVVAYNANGDGAETGEVSATVIAVDGMAPVLKGAEAAGSTLTLTWSEALDAASVPAASTFTVNVNGVRRGITGMGVAGEIVTLTLAAPATTVDTLTVGYTPPSDAAAKAIRDLAQNEAAGFSGRVVANETVIEIVAIEVTSDPGPDGIYTYGEGGGSTRETIEVTVTFSETVNVTGAPRLATSVRRDVDVPRRRASTSSGGGLVFGAIARALVYHGGSGTASLTFRHTVADGDRDTAGVSIEPDYFDLNAGTIKGASGRDALTTHRGLAPHSGQRVDAVRPRPEGLSLDSSGFRHITAGTRSAVVNGNTITLVYNKALDGTKVPAQGRDFKVWAGGTRHPTYAHGVVGGTELSVSGIAVSGNKVVLTLNEPVEHDTEVRVDFNPSVLEDTVGNTAPGFYSDVIDNVTLASGAASVTGLTFASSPGVDGAYGSSDKIDVGVQFSSSVTVDTTNGTPVLFLRVGSHTDKAAYHAGSGTAELTFRYRVSPWDVDTDGVSIEPGVIISLDGGAIDTVGSGVPATRKHAGLDDQPGHRVDGVSPHILSASVDGAVLTVTFTEALDEGAVPLASEFEVMVDGSARPVDAVAVSGSTVTLTLTSPVAGADTVTVGYTAPWGKGPRRLKDTVGNPASFGDKVPVSIAGGDPLPSVSIAAKAASVIEGGAAEFTLTASPAPASRLRVQMTVTEVGGFATAGAHQVTIPTGGTASFSVATAGDDVDEPDGSVTAALAAGAGYTVAASPNDAASVTVNDDDDAPSGVAVTPPALSVAAGGEASYGLSLRTAPAGDVTVSVSVASGASHAETDRSSVTFTPTKWSEPQPVKIMGLSEGAASVAHAVTTGDSGNYGTGIAIESVAVDVTATNLVSLSVSGNGAVDEGDPDPLKVTATLGTANATGQALAIPVQVRAAGTTAATADYTLAGTISVADGATSGEAAFTIADDGDVEDVETVVVELGSPLPSGVVAGTTDHVTIEVGDNDAPPNACLAGTVLADVQGYAKETGNGDAHVTRWKQALAAFGASNGETAMTAEEAQQHADDFWAVRWNPVVTAIECLENAANADPEIAVSGGSGITEGNDAVFTVTADPTPTADLDVTLDVADDAAGDFLDTNDEGSHTVTIPANQPSTTLTLSTTGDTTDEANGSVTATVEAGTGYTVAAGPDDAASVAVTDDDATTVTLTTPDTTAAEDDAADTAQLALTLGRGLVDGESLVAPLIFTGGTAGTLFTLTCPNPMPTGVTCQTLDSTPQVTFTGPASGASATEVTLSFAALDDTDSDNETVTVSIPASSSGNAPILTATGLGGGATGARTGNGEIAIADDDPATCATASLRPTIEGYIAEQADGTPHVTRWKQVLAAFGDDNGYTPMTASQAQKNANDFLAARWNPVVTVLQCLENAGTNTEPEITVSGGSGIAEGGDAVFTISANPAPTADLDVTLDVADDATGDFLGTSAEGSHTVTIPANQPSATLTLSTTGDTTDEANGSVTATVQAGNGYTVAAAPDDTASVAVSDDDATTVTLTTPDTTAAEDDAADTAQLALTLGRSLVDGESLAVPLQFTGGTAGTLFTLTCPNPLPTGVTCQTPDSAPQVTFTGPASGVSATEVTLSFAARDDTDSDNETVTVSIPASSSGNAPILTATGLGGGATGARTGNGEIAIADDDAPASDACYAQVKPDVESYAGETSNGTAHVNRWKRVLAAFGDQNGHTPMTVAEAQQNADDFWAVRWNPVVTALQCLENAKTGTGPEITIAGGSAVTEGGDVVFTVSADPAPTSNLTVKLTVADDATSDFLSAGNQGTQTVTIQANQRSVTLTLATENDSTDEPDGSVTATVASGTGYTAGTPSQATVAVSDDDATSTPTLSVGITPTSANEGNAGRAWATVTLGLDPVRAQPTTFKACLASTGTATRGAGEDYRFVHLGNDTPLTLTGECHSHTLAAHTASGEVRLMIRGDTAFEPDETVVVELRDPPQGVAVSGTRGSATYTIVNDDAAPPSPVLRLSAGPDVDEGDNAGFTVHADPAPQSDLTVAFTVAQSGDWLAAPGAGSRQVTLAAGATSVSQVVATLDDATDEPDGSVSVTLEAGTGYTVAAPPDDATSVAVRDNDEPEVSISAGSGVTEGSPASFTVTANPAPHADLTVSLTIGQSGDHAASGQTGTREVVVPTGGSMTFEVATVNDSTDEPDGAVTATLVAGTGYAVAASPDDTASVAVADDDAAGVPSFSVDDAEAHENEWWLRYTIRLSPASDSKVSVWVHTRESSPVSARDGEDYQGMGWGTRLVFPAGTTERKLSIRLVNDSHDEGPETFEVELLAPQGGAVIADGVGVMTIVNDDPMPAAFLARFGRTVAEQALDGIAGRMAAPRNPGVHGTIAGQSVSLGSAAAGEAANDPGTGSGAHTVLDSVGLTDSGSLARSAFARASGISADRFGGAHGSDHGIGLGDSRTVTAHELLLGSSFTATGETDAMGGSLAFWGRAAQSSFDGREGTFSLDGSSTTAMLGADYARDNWLTGLVLMQSSGEGGYADSGTGPQECPDDMDPTIRAYLCDGVIQEGNGDVEASLTAALPYAAIQASDRLKLWGGLGYGTGEVTLKPTMGGSLSSDISWTMAAAGARSDLIPLSKEESGLALALTSDALWARTSSEKTHELAASDSDVTRLRLGLEGRWKVALGDGGHVTPKLELGARHDGGDAETGFGVELGGGIAWIDPRLGLSLDLSGRTLIAHSSDDLEDRGFAASLAFDPDPASARGLSLTLSQDWGGSAQGGLDALFAPEPLDKRSGSEATARWAAEANYGFPGFPVFGGHFTGSPHIELGLATGARHYSLGWQFAPAANASAPDLSFGVRATRRESEETQPEHVIGFELGARW